MDELRPFQDPDLSLLQAGSACLAKHQDGLWHPARITGEVAHKDLSSGVFLEISFLFFIQPFFTSSGLGFGTSSGPERNRSALALSPFPVCFPLCSYLVAQPVKTADLQSVSIALDVDNGHYTVKFDSLLLKEAVLEGDSILPPLRTETTESSDSDSGDASDSIYARGMAEVRA